MIYARRAERLHLGLLLVHVNPEDLVSHGNPEYRSVHDAIAGLLESEAGRARELAPAVHVQTRLVSGETVPVLVELSASATMVVVGTDRMATRDDMEGRMILESTVSCLRARQIHLSVSDRFDSAILVVGSRGLGAVQHAIMGSVTQVLLLHVPCPYPDPTSRVRMTLRALVSAARENVSYASRNWSKVKW